MVNKAVSQSVMVSNFSCHGGSAAITKFVPMSKIMKKNHCVQHICRSATLAGWQELFGRKGMDMVLSGGGSYISYSTGFSFKFCHI